MLTLDMVQARISELVAEWRKANPGVAEAHFGVVIGDGGRIDDGDYGRDAPARPDWIAQDERGWKRIMTLGSKR
jgi:hypothetical protein